jgi:hypothetical protein
MKSDMVLWTSTPSTQLISEGLWTSVIQIGRRAEKSKNEIMQEIIQKSKFHMAERQRLKDSNQKLMIDVDADMDEIRGLLNPVRPSKRVMFEKTDYDVFFKESE